MRIVTRNFCYSSHDQTWVMTTLKPLLEENPHKYRLCLHNRDFPLGTNIIDNIDDAMERSRKTLIVLSKHFVRSKVKLQIRQLIPYLKKCGEYVHII